MVRVHHKRAITKSERFFLKTHVQSRIVEPGRKSKQMEPIEKIISFLREKIPEVDRELEEPIKSLLSKFELIPKHEYEAHMEILKSLEAQVLELEERVQSLESSKRP